VKELSRFLNFVQDWFTWKGRLSRSQFLFRYLIFAIIYYFLFFSWQFSSDTSEIIKNLTVSGYLWVVFGGGGVFMFLTVVPLMIRRFHDLGKPGNHVWLTLIPFVNLYYGLPLFFKKGVLGSNQFGNESKGWF
jgi:uncharacterized membrane protein YhaH (DUF805 family)